MLIFICLVFFQSSRPTRTISTSTPALIRQTPQYLQTPVPPKNTVIPASVKYNKKVKNLKRQQDEESDSDSDSDDEYERKRQTQQKKYSQKVSNYKLINIYKYKIYFRKYSII